MRSAVGRAPCREEARNSGQVIPGGYQSFLPVLTAPYLGMSDGCHQGIAEAFLPHGVLRLATLGYIDCRRLPGAAVANPAVGGPVGLAEIAKVADARPGQVDFLFGQGAFQLCNLERKTRGRGQAVRDYSDIAGGHLFQNRPLVVVPHSGLRAKCKRGSYLNACGSGGQGFAQLFWCAVSSGEPEWQS